MSDTWTPGYALNVLYSYAFDAPSTRRDPGLNDINMARDVLLVAIKQLAAERAIRLAAEATLEEREIAERKRTDRQIVTFKRLVREKLDAWQQRDAALAQLAERDQQLAALREARDTLCACIHDVEPDDFRACGTCWLTLDSAILALLAPQAVDGFDSTAPRLRFDSAAATLAYLTADDDPAAAPDDEIRMPMETGIPGVGVVVSAGPRPELVIERDVSSIDCERCGRSIELDEHEGDLCNDCRATMPEEAT